MSRRTALNSGDDTSRGRGRSMRMSLSIRPGPALITSTRSASSTASSTECVTKIDGHAGARPDLQKLVLELLARQRIERAERLVHQQDARRCWRARGRSRRAASCRRRAGADSGRRNARGRPARRTRRAISSTSSRGSCRCARAEADVLPHRHPGKQRVVLEHHAAVAARAGDRLALASARCRWSAPRSPATMRSSVDLPQPEAPIRQTNSPSGWSRRRAPAPRFVVADGEALGHAADVERVADARHVMMLRAPAQQRDC